jgi:hypothetical protein
MKTVVRTSLALALLGTSAFVLATLTGCGSSSATAAKNMYVIQTAQNSDSVETDSVFVFPTNATGATAPAATLNLPSGFYAVSLATGPTGKLYVGGENGENPPQILVYAAGATGNASPVTTYTAGSGTFSFPDFMTVNDQGQLFIMSDDDTIEGYAANASSSSAPAQYLTNYQTNREFSYGIGADHEGNIYVDVIDGGLINVFAAGATGSAEPSRTITGITTGSTTNSFGLLFGITADADGNVMVVSYNPNDNPFEVVPAPHSSKLHLRHNLNPGSELALKAHSDSPSPMASTGIYVFAAGASGNATAVSAISGAKTTVNEPEGMTVDALDNIYYVDFEGGSPTLMSFKAGATGNVAPTTSFTSSGYTGGGEGVDEIAAH